MSRPSLGTIALAAALAPTVGRALPPLARLNIVHSVPLPRVGSSAQPVQPTALADGEDGWYTSASSVYPATTCAINASAVAFIQSVETSDGTFVRSLVTQTNADIHNPYVFVGVTLGVSTDVVDNRGVTLATFYHEAYAGAWLDPKGNNKAYSWVDSAVMPEARLNRIDHLRIRFSNVS